MSPAQTPHCPSCRRRPSVRLAAQRLRARTGGWRLATGDVVRAGRQAGSEDEVIDGDRLVRLVEDGHGVCRTVKWLDVKEQVWLAAYVCRYHLLGLRELGDHLQVVA